MTNEKRFLKDGADVEKIAREIDIIFQNDLTIANVEQATIKYFNSTCKPQLTEDEKIILRSIAKEFTKIGRRNTGNLYLITMLDTIHEGNYECEIFKPDIFQFIQERRRISNKGVVGK